MSFQDFILNGLSSLQKDETDLRGVLQEVLNTSNLKLWFPLIDIINTEDIYYVYVELPGVKEDSILVDFINNNLIISGEKNKKINEQHYIKNEIGYGKFNRKILLPMNVMDKNNVIIKYENGLLSILIDKKKEKTNTFSMKISN